MPLVKAVVIGAVGALAIPWAVRGGSGQVIEWLHYGVLNFSVSGWHFGWSWPIFCIVTLVSWGAFKAAGDG